MEKRSSGILLGTILALTVILVMCFGTVSAHAADAVCEINGTTYTSFKKACKNVKSGQTIKLIADCDTDGSPDIKTSCVLDLNGHKLIADNGGFCWYTLYIKNENTVFTIRDTSAKQSGEFQLEELGIELTDEHTTLVMESGTLCGKVLENGEHYATCLVDLNNDYTNFKMTGGTLLADDLYHSAVQYSPLGAGLHIYHGVNITMTGGEIKSNTSAWPVYLDHFTDSKFEMTGGAITSTTGVAFRIDGGEDSTVNVKGGKITSDGTAIYNTSGENVTVDIQGGTVASKNKYGVRFYYGKKNTLNVSENIKNVSTNVTGSEKTGFSAVNLSDDDNTTINISGGTLTGGQAILLDDDADNNKIVISGNKSKPAKLASLVSGADSEICLDDAEGTNIQLSPGAVFKHKVASAHVVPGCVTAENEDEATKKDYPYTVDYKSHKLTLDANGGSFDGASTQTQKVYNGNEAKEPTENPTKEGMIFLGWTTEKDGNTFYNFSGKRVYQDFTLYAKWGTATARITKDGTYTDYASLAAAVAAAKDGDTIVMQDKETVSKSISFEGKAITLDLKAKTVTGSNISSILSVGEGASLTVEDTSNVKTGALVNDSDYATSVVTLDGAKALTAQDGTLTGKPTAISIHDAAEGGTSVQVNKGTISGDTAAIQALNSKGTVSIGVTGGKLSGTTIIDTENSADSEVSVSGGVYKASIPAEQCAQGYIPADSSDKDYPYTVAKGFVLTFDANGGTLTDDATQLIKEGNKATEPQAPTREDYVFQGWYEDEEGTGEAFDFSTAISEDTTLYAKWEGEKTDHTVTFDANGGSGAPETQTIEDGGLATEPTDVPTRSEYSFNGWYTAKEDGELFDFQETPITDNITLYAQWTEKVVSITSGGTTAYYATLQEAVNNAEEGDTIKVLKNVDLTDQVTFASKKLTLDLNDHKVLANKETIPFAFRVFGGSLTITDNARGYGSLEGYAMAVVLEDVDSFTLEKGNISGIFAGVYAINDCDDKSQIQIKGGNIKASGMDAIMIPSGSENISLDITGGTMTGGESGFAVAADSGIKLAISGGSFTTTNQGSNAADLGGKFDTTGFISGGVFGHELKSAWAAEGYLPAKNTDTETQESYPYTVTECHYVSFDANGGVLGEGSDKQAVVKGEKATKPTDPTRDYYTFKGWATKDGTAVDLDKDSINEDLTLYAQWTPVEYKISYNLDGGTNGEKNPSSYTTETDTIVLEEPTKDGWAFTGWTDESGKSVTKILKGSHGDVTLTATWSQDVVATVTTDDTTEYYSYLEDATAVATKGSTVKLVKDVTLTSESPSGGDSDEESKDAASVGRGSAYIKNTGVTLDLNGHTITATDCNAIRIINGGSLTVTDTSTFQKGTIQVTDTDAEDRLAAIWTEDATAITVKSGSLQGTQFGIVAVSNPEHATAISISGGTIQGDTTALRLSTRDTEDKAISVKVTGGTFTGSYAIYSDSKTNTLKVTGGTFQGKKNSTNTKGVDIYVPSGTKGFVTGGKFANAVPSAQCASGYAPTAKAKGYYGVTKKPGKVTISKTKRTATTKATVTWKKVSGVKGYKVVYSTSKSFKSAKTKYAKSGSSKTMKLTKLKKNKKYYVKVSAYKTVNGKKVYGSYSKVKTIKAK